MIERLAITAVGVVATVVLTVGLVAAGFAPRSSVTDAASGLVVDPALLTAAQPTSSASEAAPPEAEVVYIKPAPSPKTVVVEKRLASRGSPASSSRSATRGVRNLSSGDDDRWERGDREEGEWDD